MKKNSISVVIPTHKRPALLKRAIESVLCQTLSADEIIIVDDASCAETRKLVESFGLPNLHYIENIAGSGASSSRNLGVAKASGDYVAFLDDDDVFFPEKIEKSLEYISDSNFDVLYHPAKIEMVNEQVFYYSKPKFFSEPSLQLRELAISNIVGGTPMVVVKRNAFLNSGGFDESLCALEDYEMWLRMAINGCVFKKIDYPLTNYFYHTETASVSKNIKNNLQALKQIQLKHSVIYGILNSSELKRHELWRDKMVVHKSLLNGQVSQAIRGQFSIVKSNFKTKEMLILFSLFFGKKFVFKIKSRFC